MEVIFKTACIYRDMAFIYSKNTKSIKIEVS